MRYTTENVERLDGAIARLQEEFATIRDTPDCMQATETAIKFIQENISTNKTEEELFYGSLVEPNSPESVKDNYTRNFETPGLELIGEDAHGSLFMVMTYAQMLRYSAKTSRQRRQFTHRLLGHCADYLELRSHKSERTCSNLTEAQERIVQVIREKGHRLTTIEVFEELARSKLPSLGMTKQNLAELVRRQILTNDIHARPRGYGLPEWSWADDDLLG